MDKNLTNSAVVRQNVLNNTFAVEEIQKAVGVRGVMFERSYRFVKKQLADFYGVTERTIENCLEKNDKELLRNGYEVLKGKRLIDFKLAAMGADVPEMDFGNKTPQLGVFDFRAFLNVGMLLTDSEYKGDASYEHVVDTLNDLNLNDEYREEFKELVEKAVNSGNSEW